MQKKGKLYYPTEEFKKKAWVKNQKLYREAEKDPVKFWEKLAGQLFWFKKWQKGFAHKPPYFQWFLGGKINITENIFKKLNQKPALIWEPEPVGEKPRILTYKELFKEVCRCANYLKKLGIKKGDRVGIYLPMIPEVVVAMLACARIGAVHSVVFSAFSPSALRVRLQDTKAKVLITADKYYRRGNLVDLEKNAMEGIQDTDVKEVVLVKRKGETPWAKEKSSCLAEKMDSEDLQFILYTSGSTGKPKGCVHVCGGYTVQAYWTGKWIFDFHPNDVFWCTSDPGWVTGHTYTIYSPLLNGVTTLMFEGAPDFPTPDRWAQIIEKHKVTIFYTAPTAVRMFEKYGAGVIRKYKFRQLRLLGSVGEPIDEAAWLWYFKNVGKERCPIVDTWWQTETGGILLTSLPGVGPFKPAFTGLPFPGIKADILDEKGESCQVAKQGNLVILPPFSPSLLRGVYKNPQKYLETYWSQYGKKVYFTSDGALRDKNGLIRIIGRVDDVIKIAGHRVTTGELEAAVNLHPEIAECAVIGISDKIKGEVPAVFVVYKGEKGREIIKKEVVSQIQKEIGPIALPKKVYLVDDLPKTKSGKIMRRILRKLFTEEELGDLSTLANPKIVEEIKRIIHPVK
jgi:acetyl-CoA synthetase